MVGKSKSRKRSKSRDSQEGSDKMDVDTPSKEKTPKNKKSKENKEKKKDSPKKSRKKDTSLEKETKTKAPPAMDITVHRMRHLEYLPSHIVCLRATPDGSCVAIARDNGTVELKSPNEKFRTIAEIAGFRKKVVNCMAWTCGTIAKNNDKTNDTKSRPTLVGGSRDGSLFVIDFQTGLFTGMTSSGGGGIFALATLCQHQEGHCCADKQPCSQLVAAGCEDGSIRIYQVVDNKSLDLVSIIPSASGASILSLAWKRLRTAAPGSNGCTGTVLFAGIADGTIRRYEYMAKADESATATVTNTNNRHYNSSLGVGSWKSSLRMTVESQGRNTPTRVWALQLLSDGTVVSGDSLGHVQFWDGDTGTLVHSFDQNENKADVLDIAVANNECKVFASGIDSRVICIERLTLETSVEAERKWISSQAQRPHTHDVKSLCICRRQITDISGPEPRLPVPASGYYEVLCSGGLDTKLCTYYVGDFKKLRPKSLYPWPAFSPVAQAKDQRVLVLRRESKIDVYKLGDHQSSKPPGRALSVSESETHIGTIELESACNLSAAAISDDGKYMAACDALALLIFRLEYVQDSEGLTSTMIPTKLSLDTKFKASIVSLNFGRNNQLVAGSSGGSLHIIDMPSDDNDVDTCTFNMTLKQKKKRAQHESFLFPVQAIEFSKDKTYFAALQGGYDCCSVRVFSCEEDGKTYRHWWSLPDLEAPVSATKFTEVDESTHLIATCANYAFYVFDMKQRKLSSWSEKSGVPLSKKLPQELIGRSDYPIRIATNPSSPAKILLVSLPF